MGNESCSSVVEFKGGFDPCRITTDYIRSSLPTQCPQGASNYYETIKDAVETRFKCDSHSSYQDFIQSCSPSSFCPTRDATQQTVASNEEEAELSFLQWVYHSPCASLMATDQCLWRWDTEQWIFGCTGDAKYAFETAQELESMVGCDVAPTDSACIGTLSCAPEGSSANVWYSILSTAATTFHCNALPSGVNP